MNLISAAGISKAFTERWLFRNISFGLSEGEKIALVGSNGTGKSTLLKVLAELIAPDEGDVARLKGSSFGYLPQEPELNPDISIEQCLFDDDNPVMQLVKRYETAIELPDFPAAEMQEILEQMERLDAWDFEKKAARILGKLGIHNLKQLNGSLSGGQKKRVALAKLLILNPDVLILDEPTNHLDLEAIEWLETLLNAHRISLIMVTHDRYFLDNVSSKILELDRGRLFVHEGKYADYLENKFKRETIEATEISKARNLMSKELEWMRRMPKARGTKSKSRIEAFYEIKSKAESGSIKKQVEINVGTGRLGNKIIEAEHISKSYVQGKPLISDFSYIFKKKDRIGVIGKNGSGKSTLLNILTETIQPDSGSIIHGPTLKIGYYTQHSNTLDNSKRIIDEVREIAEYVTLGTGEQVSVSRLLDMFLFPPGVQHTPVAKLSGGERRRLQLLKVLVENPNFLILDEPTNDLDIDTLNVLEEFLQNYEGCLMLVSHDRYFMDKLVEHLFVFEEQGRILDYYGNYTDYRSEYDSSAEDNAATPKTLAATYEAVQASDNNTTKKKLSFKEQRELESLESEIERLESRKAELHVLLSSGSNNHTELSAWSDELLKLEAELSQKGDRWLELSDI